MRYRIELEEAERDLLLKATTEMVLDKEFGERTLAGQLLCNLVYSEPIDIDDGKHFTE